MAQVVVDKLDLAHKVKDIGNSEVNVHNQYGVKVFGTTVVICRGDKVNGTHVNTLTFLAMLSVEGSPSLASDSSNIMSEFDSSTTWKQNPENSKQFEPDFNTTVDV